MRVSTGRRVAGLPGVVSIANSLITIVPTGAAQAPVADSVIEAPSGKPIHRRFFVPSDHSSLTMSYGTRPACGVAAAEKQPVASSVGDGLAGSKPQPAIEPRDIPTGAVAGPLNRAIWIAALAAVP